MFTWGELKETLRTGKLERLMRNKEMQARYDAWVRGIKGEYGTTGESRARGVMDMGRGGGWYVLLSTRLEALQDTELHIARDTLPPSTEHH